MSNYYRAATPEKRKVLINRLIHLSYPTKYDPPFTEIPFGEIVRVWADFAEHELERESGNLFALLSTEAKRKLKENLIQQLSDHCAPTLAALMHVAKSDKKLEGNTPKDRYLFYIEKILPKLEYLKELFFYFPPLAKFISSQILLWIDQAVELLSRLNTDLPAIQIAFKTSLKQVSDLSLSLSDLHNGNRSVYKLQFDNGFLLIYKPKPLKLDKAYNYFIHELNQFPLELKLKTFQILDKDTYGWVEFIETAPCENEQEVGRYFHRLGMLICIMFILEGTDCHYENIIASGENPVLIDLESLFHPTLKSFKKLPELTIWNSSVFRTGFLPSFGISVQRKLDISPLTAEEEQESPRPSAQWQDVNTDQMQFVFLKKRIKLKVPRPKLHGKLASAADNVSNLLEGFEKMYRLFVLEKSKILHYLNDLFHYPVRCIFRHTQLYSQILQRLTDPKLMRSDEEVEKTLDILMRYAYIKENPELAKIAEREKEALLHGDIPFFMSYPKDCYLYDGNEVLAKNCFEKPSEEIVKRKIQDLNEKDLLIQLQFIEHSLYYLKSSDRKQSYNYKAHNPAQNVKMLTEQELLTFAERIGQKILDLSLTLSDGTLAWIALEMEPKLERYVFQPVSNTFYSGTSGIAFFLAALGKTLGKPRFIDHAKGLMDRLKNPFYDDPEAAMLVSYQTGMSGLGGLIYSFAAIGQILREDQYLKDASYIASLIKKDKIEQDTFFDLLLGSAGLILALLSLYDKTNEKWLLEKAKEAGYHLLNHVENVGAFSTWATINGKYLCGLSHGVSGIAYALFKLAEKSKDKRFLDAAEKGLLYEDSLYSPEKLNWPDLRLGDGNYQPRSWCHGSPGIELARIFLSKLLPQKQLDSKIELLRNHLIGDLDHLCCGNFGRLAILWDAAQILGKNSLKQVVLEETSLLLHKFEKTGNFTLFYKLPEEIQSPSLMTGLSGIGYFLLRLTKSGTSLPEILILE